MQKGFIDLSGLAVNDPKVEQYQLWILDKSKERPNAGVFDITAGKNIFEFRPGIDFTAADGFAVTIEKPGGVVVSDLSRVPLIGNVPGSNPGGKKKEQD